MTEKTTVVMGRSKVRVDRPRVRALDGGEPRLETLGLFQNEATLSQAILIRLLPGIRTRKYAQTTDGGIADLVCTSESKISIHLMYVHF